MQAVTLCVEIAGCPEPQSGVGEAPADILKALACSVEGWSWGLGEKRFLGFCQGS